MRVLHDCADHLCIPFWCAMKIPLTPEQELKLAILLEAIDYNVPNSATLDSSAEEIESIFNSFEGGELQDAINEFRCSGEDTNIQSPYSRHYESKAVALEMPTGVWVGWTYWYGGGKYGEPEGIDWIDSAYFVSVLEEEKMVTIRTFSQVMP